MTTFTAPPQPAARHGRRPLAAVIAALPLLWLPLVLAHPEFDHLSHHGVGTWLIGHFGMLALTPPLAAALLYRLWSLTGAAAAMARFAVVAWAALFSAFDGIAGIATGTLHRHGAGDAAAVLFGDGIVGGAGSVLGFLAQPMWIVVAVATGLALRRAGAGMPAQVAMIGSLLFAAHGGPVAAVGLVALAVALWTTRTVAQRTATGSAERVASRD
ncbi:MAG TPA: hypothetical protein VK925_07640 [Jiangellaceae bacterium]|nr:hypothetical protein [Jiangellaceae bacterium]